MEANMIKINREIKCKNEVGDILLKNNCHLIGDITINMEIFGKITKDILKDGKSKIIITQNNIQVISDEQVDSKS